MIIAGSRDIVDHDIIKRAIKMSGVDIEAIKCFPSGFPIKLFPALWEVHGKGAGYIRNSEMAEYADALIAIWDGESKGTKHMISQMRKYSKPLYVYQLDTHSTKIDDSLL